MRPEGDGKGLYPEGNDSLSPGDRGRSREETGRVDDVGLLVGFRLEVRGGRRWV